MWNYQQIGMEHFVPVQNNYFLEQMLDNWAWIMIKLMYSPYDLPSQMSDVEKWATDVSLNGARWSNMCNPL